MLTVPNHDYIPSCGCNGCTIGRLTRELGDAKQSIIDLQGANAAYVRANGKLRAELKAAESDLAQATTLLSTWHVLQESDGTDMDELFDVDERTAEFVKRMRPSVQPSGGQS